jgi:hypothetical protein
MLPFEEKLILVTTSTTITAMELHGLWFRLELGLLTWILIWDHLAWFLSFLPNKLIPHVTLELDGFLKIIGWVRKYGWI